MEDPGGKGSLDAGAGRISAGMEDTGHAVGALAGQRKLAVVGIEPDTERYEVDDPFRSFFAEDADRVRVAQAGAGGEGVLVVQVGGVRVADCGGYTALGPKGVAVFEGRLGKNQYAAVFLSK